MVKVEYVNNPNELQNALKELKKIQVVSKILHEFENEILRDYVGEFERVVD